MVVLTHESPQCQQITPTFLRPFPSELSTPCPKRVTSKILSTPFSPSALAGSPNPQLSRNILEKDDLNFFLPIREIFRICGSNGRHAQRPKPSKLQRSVRLGPTFNF